MRRAHARSDDSPLMPARTSLGVAIAGLAMLAVQFVVAKGAGDTWRMPWDVVQDASASLALRAMHVLWAATALWAVCTAFTKAARVRAAVLAALAGATIVVALRGVGGFTLGAPAPAEWLGLTALGGGLLIAREPSRRGLGRGVAALGVLTVLWVLATSFPPARIGGPNRLQGYGFDVMEAFDDLGAHWRPLLGQTLLLVGCLSGVFATLGLTARSCLWVGVIAILAGLLAPGVIDAFEADEFALALLVPPAVPAVLWALGAFAALDLARGRA